MILCPAYIRYDTALIIVVPVLLLTCRGCAGVAVRFVAQCPGCGSYVANELFSAST